MTDTEMKKWQHGFKIEYLLELEQYWNAYNNFSCSPFSAFKKNSIAAGLKDESLKMYWYGDKRQVMMESKIVKASSTIYMYSGNRCAIGDKQKGDRVIKHLAWVPGQVTLETVPDLLTGFDEATWFYVWAEDERSNFVARRAGYKWIGSKVTTFGEIYAIYFKDTKTNVLFTEPRRHPVRNAVEDCSLVQLDVTSMASFALAEELSKVDTEYTDHYSNYNKKHSWSALSLRGYTSDPAFITKPEEMNKKWVKEHENVKFDLQDTELRAILSSVEPLLSIFESDFHRIRLMRLVAGGGELRRHTDQVDPDSGVEDGQIMRFHFPLVTNDDVEFTMWGVDGNPKSANMKVGECWYLDIRKPHRAINNGDTDRIHLVVDVVANDAIRELVYDHGTTNET